MAIDARAKTECTLGSLVSASISDDYIQGSGLIKTSGSCIINGLITPDPGTVVRFSYTRYYGSAQVKRNIPRVLRVLSSFADPFRGTTSVQLGCKLTYTANIKEAYTTDAFDDPLNEDLTEEDQAIIILPISAFSAATECISKLGLTLESGSSVGVLTNKFSIASFDYSAGYVAVLSDLLVSEGYFGYLNGSEKLVIKSLNEAPGTVPCLTNGGIIDISEINSGDLPGDSVVVSYSTLRLKDPDTTDENASSQALWEFEETFGAYEYTTITAQGINDETLSYEYNNLPHSRITTTYDKWDRIVSKIEEQVEVRGAFLFSSYLSAYLADAASRNEQDEMGIARNIAGALFNLATKTEVTYKLPAVGDKPEEGYDEIEKEVTTKQEYNLNVFCACNVNYMRQGVFSSQNIYPMETEITTTTYEKSSKSITSKPVSYWAWDDIVAPGTTEYFTDVTKTVTSKVTCYGYTPLGQSDISTRNDQGIEAPDSHNGILTLVDGGTESRLTTGREVGLQSRPGTSDLIAASTSDNGDPNNGYSTPSVTQLELAYGGISDTSNRVEFSLPYAPDDTFNKVGVEPNQTYTATASDAASKANAFGRIQNKLLLGNRYGMNIQTLPEYLPSNPYSGFIVQGAGYQVAYRTNGTTWTMDANGVIVSTDGLFEAGIGGTGDAWFPVAPGAVIPSTTPPVSDSTPAQYIGSLPNVYVQ